jgi:O-antigen/teichoic acid export membrane protein
VTVAAGLVLDVPTAWIPFGALVVANALSLAFALAISRIGALRRAPVRLSLSSLVAKGKWLVVQSAAPSVMGFAVSAIIVWLASPEALGFAESARVVAQPIIVLATGFTAVLAPRSMRAAMDRDLATAERTSRLYLSIVAAATVGYLVVAGWDWALNPMAVIVPSAYEVGGLVAFTVLANFASAGVFLQFNELLGAHRERTLAWIAWTEGVAMLASGLSAGVTGAFARPLANLTSSVVRWFLQRGALRGVYAEPTAASTSGEVR